MLNFLNNICWKVHHFTIDWLAFVALSNISTVFEWSVSGIFLLFHPIMALFFCQCHIVFVTQSYDNYHFPFFQNFLAIQVFCLCIQILELPYQYLQKMKTCHDFYYDFIKPIYQLGIIYLNHAKVSKLLTLQILSFEEFVHFMYVTECIDLKIFIIFLYHYYNSRNSNNDHIYSSYL